MVDTKSVIIEHPKTSPKLSKVIRQAEKVSKVGDTGKNSDRPSYSEIEKSENFLDEKNAKITKGHVAYKGYASTYF